MFPGHDKLADLETQWPNCDRVQWYVNFPEPPPPHDPRPPYGLADLDDFLTHCAALHVLPILGLWDLTCAARVSRMNTELAPWWTEPAVVAVLNGHKEFLLVSCKLDAVCH